MLRLASDADVNGAIIRGLHHEYPELDLVRVQDALPEGTPDPDVLDWAAAEGRILLTNDRRTMIAHAASRVREGKSVVPLIVTNAAQTIGKAVEDIMTIAVCVSVEEMHARQNLYPPIR